MHTRNGWTIAVYAVFLGCGGSPAPTTQVTVPVVALSASEPATCNSVAAKVTVAAAAMEFLGGQAVEQWRAMVVVSCVQDHWPQPVIDCVVRTTDTSDECTALMPEQTRDNYTIREQQWSAVWQPSCRELNGSLGAGAWHVAVEQLAPRIDELPGDLRKFALGLRDHAFENACDALGIVARRCFAAAKTSAQLADCRAKLTGSEAAALDHQMARGDNLVVALREPYRRPSLIECGAVLAKHYGDPAWNGRFTRLPAGERKAMITESRARLRDACPKLANSARACLVVVSDDEDALLCNLFDPASLAQGSAGPVLSGSDFGFPASGVVFSTGITDCDRYATAARVADRCAGIPAATRTGIRAQFTYVMRGIDNPALVESITFACSGRAAEIEKQVADAGCAKPGSP